MTTTEQKQRAVILKKKFGEPPYKFEDVVSLYKELFNRKAEWGSEIEDAFGLILESNENIV